MWHGRCSKSTNRPPIILQSSTTPRCAARAATATTKCEGRQRCRVRQVAGTQTGILGAQPARLAIHGIPFTASHSRHNSSMSAVRIFWRALRPDCHIGQHSVAARLVLQRRRLVFTPAQQYGSLRHGVLAERPAAADTLTLQDRAQGASAMHDANHRRAHTRTLPP